MEDFKILAPLDIGEEERKFTDLAYSRYRRWNSDNGMYYKIAQDCRAALHLKDPGQDGNGKYETLQLQTLLSTFKNCIADQMDNLPEAMMLPERPEMEAQAEDLTDIVRYVLTLNRFDSALHRRLVEDCFGVGSCIAKICWDPDMAEGKGDIAVLRWPLENFIWDPGAENIQDARALMLTSWHPIEWYRDHYPERGGYVTQESGEEENRAVSQQGIDTQEGEAMMLEYWWRTYDHKKRRYHINVAYFAAGLLLEKFEDVYAHGMYPFATAAFSQIEGQPIGGGLVEELLPMMRYINRYARYADENMRMSAKIRMLVKTNANINEDELADWSQNLIHGDSISEEAVRWMQSKPLNGLWVQQMQQFQSDMKQDSGQNSFNRGESAGGITAASAISALQEAGNKQTRMHTQCLNQMFRDMVWQILWLISQFYEDGRVRMITGIDNTRRQVDASAFHLMGEDALPPETRGELDGFTGEMQSAILNNARQKAAKRRAKGTIPPPPYTVQIQVQRRNPLRIQAQNELYIQAYTMAAQAGQMFPLSLLFDLLVVDGKERIMPILRQVDQQTQMLQQLAAENEQLKANEQNLRKALGDSSAAAIQEANQALVGTEGQEGAPDTMTQLGGRPSQM